MGHSSTLRRMRQDARTIFLSGVKAVDPKTAVHHHLHMAGGRLFIGRRTVDLSAVENIYVVGAGKATAPMAAAVEEILSDRIRSGVISIKYGHQAPLRFTQIREAAHPVPDDNGRLAAQEIREIARRAGEKDLILCLISGGGSALLPLPADGIPLADKQATVKMLLHCGADIHEINTVRKHISAVKGGCLAREAFPAPVFSLILSDVIGDDLDVIASGPTVGDPTTYQDALRVLRFYHLEDQLPPSIGKHLRDGESGRIPETPKPDDVIFSNNGAWIIGGNFSALAAASLQARQLGYQTIVLSSMIAGDTREAAGFHAAIAREVRTRGNPLAPPACILSGGETTVRVIGKGKGGRNQEFALAIAPAIAGMPDTLVLSAGTDGTDGPTDAAGAFADGETLQRSTLQGMDIHQFLSDNDSYHFFEALGDLFITGPTCTNVMDLRVVLIQ